MRSVLEDHSELAANLRRLLSAGVASSEAAELMSRVATGTRNIPLRKMDDWERAIRAEVGAAERNSVGTSRTFWARRRRFPWWLDLCSHDGHKREAALRVLSGGAPSAFLLALALRRLNDWVPQVRNAARATLPELAFHSDPEDVADALWSLLAHWNTWGRAELADREVLDAVVSNEPVAFALRSKILSATAGPGALVLSQCARSGAFDGWIPDFAKGAAQPAVRARAFRWLLLGKCTWVVGRFWKWTDLAYCKGKFEPILESRDISTTEPFRVTLATATGDKSAVVRCVAAEFLIREISSLGGQAIPLARQLATDTSPSVANRGRFALKQLGLEGSSAE